MVATVTKEYVAFFEQGPAQKREGEPKFLDRKAFGFILKAPGAMFEQSCRGAPGDSCLKRALGFRSLLCSLRGAREVEARGWQLIRT